MTSSDLWDTCQTKAGLLAKIQPVVGISPMCFNAEDAITKSFPGKPKKIKSSLTKATKAVKKCNLCGSKFSESSARQFVLVFDIDWEDQESKPSKLLACCEGCYSLSVYSEAMSVYVRETLQEPSEEGHLSHMVAHFLKANKLRVSDINIFYGAISVAVSLRTTLAALGVEFSVAASDIDSFIAGLVSSS